MAYRYGNRKQMSLLPPSIEDYISPDDPVRAYDAFVDALNLAAMGIEYDDEQVGCPEYDPRSMLKLLVYGYSYSSDRSSRKLERAVYHNLSFIWLLGGLKPDHKTISHFRRRHREALSKVLKQSARLCLKLGMIDGNILFVDGSKVRANASLRHTWNEKKCKETLQKVDKRIDELLAECETIDRSEESEDSLVKVRAELLEKRSLKERVEAIAVELKDEERKSLNTVDRECAFTKSIHGTYAGYNAQIAVDEKHGLIASCDVINKNHDQGVLSGQVQMATEVLGKPCKMVVADGGYSDLGDIAKIDDQIAVLVPVQRQSEKHAEFRYDPESDFYVCPEGHMLKPFRIDPDGKRIQYKISDPKLCRKCQRFGLCTKCKSGRTIARSFFEETSNKVLTNFNRPESQSIYKLRAQKAELPFGYLRRTLGVRAFLLRGLQGVKAEMSLYASAFNIRRMITIQGGVPGFIAAVGS